MTKEKELTIENLLAAQDPGSLLADAPFEQAMKLLEELVAAVERGSLPLERAIQSYERGAIIVEHLRAVLSRAEARLTVLKKNRATGEITSS